MNYNANLTIRQHTLTFLYQRLHIYYQRLHIYGIESPIYTCEPASRAGSSPHRLHKVSYFAMNTRLLILILNKIVTPVTFFGNMEVEA